ncbi:hypothetical protein V8E55_008944 [Tylopilus felleus]
MYRVQVLSLVINLVSQWTWFLFLAAADLVMILRVWAMYNRSRVILGILLAIYIVENVLSCVGVIYYNIPNHTTVTITQILNISFCSVGSSVTTWTNITSISQLVLGSTMCTLVIFRFLKQSISMYKATKQWQGNRYVNLLAREGMLYFLVEKHAELTATLLDSIQVFNLVLVLSTLGKLPTEGAGWIIATILQYVPLFTFTPRFVISMRELYARDTQGRVSGVDNAFGLSALSGRDTFGTMVFAEVEQEQNEGTAAEEVPVEEVEIRELSRDAGITQQARGPQLCSGSGRYQLGRTVPNTGGLDKVLDWTPFSGGKPRTAIVCADDGVGV